MKSTWKQILMVVGVAELHHHWATMQAMHLRFSADVV